MPYNLQLENICMLQLGDAGHKKEQEKIHKPLAYSYLAARCPLLGIQPVKVPISKVGQAFSLTYLKLSQEVELKMVRWEFPTDHLISRHYSVAKRCSSC
jgi:hypothetical protein